jgi:peptide/nickel transport system permease protein
MSPVARFLLMRAGSGLVALVAVSLIVFLGTELLPGDAATAILGQAATPQAVAELRAQLGLDQPVWARYLGWVAAAMQGDFGTSFSSGRPVADLLFPRLGRSLILAGAAAAVVTPLAIGVGILAALNREGLIDRGILGVSMLLLSIPSFLMGYLLIKLFAVELGWFPALSVIRGSTDIWGWMRALVLPVLTLTFVASAHTMRLTRTAVVAVLASDYVMMAEIKGLEPRTVILRHALPNALSPILSIAILTFAYMIVGVVVVEVVFSYAGLSKLMVDAVSYRDLPMVQACGVVFSLVFIGLNLVADVLAMLANPRVRTAA